MDRRNSIGLQISRCRSCGAEIVWMKTDLGKNIPVDADDVVDPEATVFDPDTMTSHFATCPDANKWRKKSDAKNVPLL